jgi:hypothetical protein
MITFTEHKAIIPNDFNPKSRVWIYQSSRLFSFSEAFELETLMEEFIANWKSHGAAVKGYANLFYGQFIVLMADESEATVGGCSTDSSVRLIKQIEDTFKVDMFNRQSLAFVVKDKVQILPIHQMNYAMENGFINDETLYFNNLVATKEDLINNWIIPINKSWLINKINKFLN